MRKRSGMKKPQKERTRKTKTKGCGWLGSNVDCTRFQREIGGRSRIRQGITVPQKGAAGADPQWIPTKEA